jgi:Zn-dependent peptidase ImmA (M78 family)
MKNCTVGEYEKRDIQQQVDKVLRGLGNPEPPLDLREVRELLKLDLEFYSNADDDVVKEIVSRVKIGLKQIVWRPTILWDVIKKASLSALWVPDRKRILLDATTPKLKHRWFEGHETLHSIIPWHEQFLYGDTAKELNPACEEAIEAEANYGAGQLLFLRDRFAHEAKDMPMTIATIKTLAKRFGNTITSHSVALCRSRLRRNAGHRPCYRPSAVRGRRQRSAAALPPLRGISEVQRTIRAAK